MGRSPRRQSPAHRSFSQRAIAIATRHGDSHSSHSQAERKANRKPIPIQCRSYDAYTCQLSLLITLNSRSYDTFRLVGHSDSNLCIQVLRPEHARYRYSTELYDFIYEIGEEGSLHVSLDNLKALEENLLAALSILHRQRISFPISTKRIELVKPSAYRKSTQDVANQLTLFLSYNEKATWETSKLPPNWQAAQLSKAKSIFLTARLLLELSHPSPKLNLDLPSQQALATYFRKTPCSRHIELCLGIAPMTAELAYEICHALLRVSSRGQDGLDFLDTFFGGPMPLPKPGTSVDTIYNDFVQQRARVCDAEKHHGDNESDESVQDPGSISRLNSPATLTRLVCCRAEAATLLGESCRVQWWLIAMDLYDAFISDPDPASGLERTCAFDLNHYRD